MLVLLLLPLLVHLLLLIRWRRLHLGETVVLQLGRRRLRSRVLELELLLLRCDLAALNVCTTSLSCVTNY